MYWKKFRLLTVFIFFVFGFTFTGCNTNEETGFNNQVKPVEIADTISFKKKMERLIETKLDIPATEDYSIQIKRKHINPDTTSDALILINRMDYAYKRAKSNSTENFFNNTGHTGPYNYVFVYNGSTKKLISRDPFGSTSDISLTSQFLELTSAAHQDFYVNYRIRNSMFRNYYTVRKDDIYLTFSCPVFDSIGQNDPVAYAIEHPRSSVRIAKDIALYKGKIVGYNSNNIENVNAYYPKQIIKVGDLYAYFIFDQKSMKYKTPMRKKEPNTPRN